MTKKLLLSSLLNIVILYIVTPFLAFQLYNLGIANTNLIKWFSGLNIQFSFQTPVQSSGLEYIVRPMAFIVCFTWVVVETIIIAFSKKTLLDNLLNLRFTNSSLLQLKLIFKIILKHSLLLTASLGIPTYTGFYYPDLFAFHIFGIMFIFDIFTIILSKGQYSGINYILRLKYIKNDPIK